MNVFYIDNFEKKQTSPDTGIFSGVDPPDTVNQKRVELILSKCASNSLYTSAPVEWLAATASKY